MGAPANNQNESTAEDSTPKKGASSSSSSSVNEAKTPASVKKEVPAPVVAAVAMTATTKPLTALQQANADAKKAEADRMASLAVNKKGAKKA